MTQTRLEEQQKNTASFTDGAESRRGAERFVSLKNDYAFTQIMRNETVLKGFLNAVLKIPVNEITQVKILDRHLERLSEDDKLGILDVRVSIREKEDIDTELQIRWFQYWTHRTIFYLSKMYTEHIKKGDWYAKCRKVIHISILDFNLFTEEAYFYSCYHLREDSTNRMYSDLLELHVVELKKLTDCPVKEEDKVLEKWCRLISAKNEEELTMIKTDPYIKAAIDEMERIKTDEEKYNEYEQRERALRDYMSQLESERKQGEEEGERKGEKKGEKKGEAEERQRHSCLILKLMKEGKNELVLESAENPKLLEKLYKEYGI